MTGMRFRREWFLVIAFFVIMGMVLYKKMQSPQGPTLVYSASNGEFPAPPLQLHDHRSRMTRLAAYQGRHPILVVFYLASQGPDHHALLLDLRKRFEEFQKRGIKILAVSAATPYYNREAFKRGGDFPFSFLSDPTLQAHSAWRTFDTERTQPRQSAFLIDRRGIVKAVLTKDQFPTTAEELLKQFDEWN